MDRYFSTKSRLYEDAYKSVLSWYCVNHSNDEGLLWLWKAVRLPTAYRLVLLSVAQILTSRDHVKVGWILVLIHAVLPMCVHLAVLTELVLKSTMANHLTVIPSHDFCWALTKHFTSSDGMKNLIFTRFRSLLLLGVTSLTYVSKAREYTTISICYYNESE